MAIMNKTFALIINLTIIILLSINLRSVRSQNSTLANECIFLKINNNLHSMMKKLFELLQINNNITHNTHTVKLLLKTNTDLKRLAEYQIKMFQQVVNDSRVNYKTKSFFKLDNISRAVDDELNVIMKAQLKNETNLENPKTLSDYNDTPAESLEFIKDFLHKIDKLSIQDIIGPYNKSQEIEIMNTMAKLLTKRKKYNLKKWSPPNSSEEDSIPNTRKLYKGIKSNVKNYPFMVSIHVNRVFVCGGSIISKDLVITAASCFHLVRDIDANARKPSLYVRVASDFTNVLGEMLPITEVHSHPNFKLRHLKNNIAIAQVDGLKTIKKKKIRRIPLERKEKWMPTQGIDVKVLGWGDKDPSSKSKGESLSVTHIQIYSFEECVANYTRSFISKQNYCGGLKDKGGGDCNHDIGSPGIVRGALTGVVSFGATNAPTVFTDITQHLDWIETVLRKVHTNSQYQRGDTIEATLVSLAQKPLVRQQEKQGSTSTDQEIKKRFSKPQVYNSSLPGFSESTTFMTKTYKSADESITNNQRGTNKQFGSASDFSIGETDQNVPANSTRETGNGLRTKDESIKKTQKVITKKTTEPDPIITNSDETLKLLYPDTDISGILVDDVLSKSTEKLNKNSGELKKKPDEIDELLSLISKDENLADINKTYASDHDDGKMQSNSKAIDGDNNVIRINADNKNKIKNIKSDSEKNYSENDDSGEGYISNKIYDGSKNIIVNADSDTDVKNNKPENEEDPDIARTNEKGKEAIDKPPKEKSNKYMGFTLINNPVLSSSEVTETAIQEYKKSEDEQIDEIEEKGFNSNGVSNELLENKVKQDIFDEPLDVVHLDKQKMMKMYKISTGKPNKGSVQKKMANRLRFSTKIISKSNNMKYENSKNILRNKVNRKDIDSNEINETHEEGNQFNEQEKVTVMMYKSSTRRLNQLLAHINKANSMVSKEVTESAIQNYENDVERQFQSKFESKELKKIHEYQDGSSNEVNHLDRKGKPPGENQNIGFKHQNKLIALDTVEVANTNIQDNKNAITLFERMGDIFEEKDMDYSSSGSDSDDASDNFETDIQTEEEGISLEVPEDWKNNKYSSPQNSETLHNHAMQNLLSYFYRRLL